MNKILVTGADEDLENFTKFFQIKNLSLGIKNS